MSELIAELRKRVVLPDGKLKRGALSRLQEHLGGSRETIRNVVLGNWQFGPEKLRLVEKVLENKKGKFPLCSKKIGRPLKNKVCQ